MAASEPKKLRTQITFTANGKTLSVALSGPVVLSGNRQQWAKQLEDLLVAQARQVAKQAHAHLST